MGLEQSLYPAVTKQTASVSLPARCRPLFPVGVIVISENDAVNNITKYPGKIPTHVFGNLRALCIDMRKNILMD